MLRLPFRNNIAQAEGRYQQHTQPRRRRWQRHGGRWLLRLTFTLAIILFGAEFIGALLRWDTGFISEALALGNLLPVTVTTIWHFGLMLQTLILSANSIAREKQAGSWELLILTGVDARRIILGKWWATVQRQWHNYLLLGILRGALIAWVGAYFSREFMKDMMAYAGSGISGFVLPAPVNFPLVLALAVLLTLANLFFTAACGVLASAASHNPAVALVRAFFIRAIILALPTAIAAAVFAAFVNYYSQPRSFFTAAVITLLDNGTTTLISAARYRSDLIDNLLSTDQIIIIIVVSLVFYGLFTWLVLRSAVKNATRQGALPPPRSTHFPSKSKHLS